MSIPEQTTRPLNGMVDIEAPIAPQPVIKDVTTLKANLKEEKRARAEADAERTAGEIPAAAHADTQTERRKRRKVSGAPSESTEQAGDPTEKDLVLDGPIPPSKTASEPAKVDEVAAPVSDIAPAPAVTEAAPAAAVAEPVPAEGAATEVEETVVESADNVAAEAVVSEPEKNGDIEPVPEVIEPTVEAVEVAAAAAS